MDNSFDFDRDHDGTLKLENAIFQAIGAASVCWTETPSGVFDSDKAKIIADKLIAEIKSTSRMGVLLGEVVKLVAPDGAQCRYMVSVLTDKDGAHFRLSDHCEHSPA